MTRSTSAAICCRKASGATRVLVGIAFKHYAKPTNTRVAPLPLRQQIAAEVDLVIEGLSD